MLGGLAGGEQPGGACVCQMLSPMLSLCPEEFRGTRRPVAQRLVHRCRSQSVLFSMYSQYGIRPR